MLGQGALLVRTECLGSSSRPAPALHSQHEEKEKAFKEQLAHLASLLPTLQVGPGRVTHPLVCQALALG